jgi:hypothetical protein
VIRIVPQAFKNMAWGAASGASQWAGKLRANDEKLNSLFVMPFRKMAEKDWIELCDALGEVAEYMYRPSHRISSETHGIHGVAALEMYSMQFFRA